jgi:predicted metal-dependent hydrolase
LVRCGTIRRDVWPAHATTTAVHGMTAPDQPLPYSLRRSSRSRGLRVTVDPWAGVVVSVPPVSRRGWAHPEARIEAFLRERESWLRRHLDRFAQERAELAARGRLGNGALIRYRGVLHEVRIEPAAGRVRRSMVTREGGERTDELVVRIATADRRPIQTVLTAWLRERARGAIERSIANQAPALGVTPAAISLRDPRTRWGSASRHGRLSFSWRLVLAPPEALDTVVIHELAHLRVFGHGQRFWELVAERRPDHRAWRRWLHVHSTELHGTLPPDGRLTEGMPLSPDDTDDDRAIA